MILIPLFWGQVLPDDLGGAASSNYFPDRSLDHADLRLDRFMRQWYSRCLAAMNEPSLFEHRTAGDEVYRFLWLRTFHEPIAIRVWRTTTQWRLIAVELDGAGGYEPGRVRQVLRRALLAEEWAELEARLEAAHFWGVQPDDNPIGLDGAEWILEGCRDGQYRVTTVWSPGDGERFRAYRAACLHFLQLSGLKVAEERIY